MAYNAYGGTCGLNDEGDQIIYRNSFVERVGQAGSAPSSGVESWDITTPATVPLPPSPSWSFKQKSRPRFVGNVPYELFYINHPEFGKIMAQVHGLGYDEELMLFKGFYSAFISVVDRVYPEDVFSLSPAHPTWHPRNKDGPEGSRADWYGEVWSLAVSNYKSQLTQNRVVTGLSHGDQLHLLINGTVTSFDKVRKKWTTTTTEGTAPLVTSDLSGGLSATIADNQAYITATAAPHHVYTINLTQTDGPLTWVDHPVPGFTATAYPCLTVHHGLLVRGFGLNPPTASPGSTTASSQVVDTASWNILSDNSLARRAWTSSSDAPTEAPLPGSGSPTGASCATSHLLLGGGLAALAVAVFGLWYRKRSTRYSPILD